MQIQLMVGHLIILLQVFKQWGLSSNSSSGDSNIEVVYPITFSNIYCVVPNLFSTTASYNNAGGGADNIISSNSKSFIFHHGSDVANCKLYWIAIGTQYPITIQFTLGEPSSP